MTKKPRRWLKRILTVILILVILFIMQLLTLAYPSVLFSNSFKAENLELHFSEAINPVNEQIGLNVLKRIRNLELYDSNNDMKVFVCESSGLYSFFARLTFVPNTVPGFNLSIFDNSFVSVPLLNERQITNHGWAVYSAIEGNLEQSIAHELIHNMAVAKLGYFDSQKIPAWKSEGYAEYGASIAIIRADSSRLADRIHDYALTIGWDDRAQWYYKNGLIVEYLSEYKNYSFDDIMSDSLTRETAEKQMMDWYKSQETEI